MWPAVMHLTDRSVRRHRRDGQATSLYFEWFQEDENCPLIYLISSLQERSDFTGLKLKDFEVIP